jgi:hypothetical protein
MRTRYFRLGVLAAGVSAAVAAAQGPSYPPLPPLQPGPLPAAPVVPVGGQTQEPPVASLPTPPVALPSLGQPPMGDPMPPAGTAVIPATPAIAPPPITTIPPAVTLTPPAVTQTPPVAPSPAAPVQPTTGVTKPETKISVTLSNAPTDGAARFDAALAEAKVAYAKLRDYSCHLKKVERINGKLGAEQTAELYARTKPASIYLKFISPRDVVGSEACFVDGKFAGNAKFRYKPAGVLGVGGFQTMAIDDPRVLAASRHTIDHCGIGALIDQLDKGARTEKRLANPVMVTAAEYTFADRPVVKFETVTATPHAHRYCYRTVVYIDKETKLPVRFEAYDVPSPASPDGELLECYSYVNLKLNPGHGSAVFDR